jgi:hypothetical protein
MIINTHTIIITLVAIAAAAYLGLRAIRAFALSIAQENHDAVLAMDAKDDKDRRRRERDADAALATATAKVAPLLPPKTQSGVISGTKFPAEP